MSEQPANLERVSHKIARVILSFCAGLRSMGKDQFHMEDLRQYVVSLVPESAPDSPSRVLRLLRAEGRVRYVVVSRSESLYRLTGSQGELFP